MAIKLQELKWKLHCYKQKQLLIYGLNNGLIMSYDGELIEKLRNIYYGGIPASIILLSNYMTNGHCYDRALLMSKAFLDDEGDVKLLYASIASLRLNPNFTSNSSLYADHCIVERITKDRRCLIYDTSTGFIYDKRIYWLIEKPKIRKINNKETIKKFIRQDNERWPENPERDKFASVLILPMIENTFGEPTEMYSAEGIELLQREIKHYKQKINYNDIVEEMTEDIKRLELKRRK